MGKELVLEDDSLHYEGAGLLIEHDAPKCVRRCLFGC